VGVWDDLVVGEGVCPSYDELAGLVAAQAVELARAREEIAALRAEVAALKRAGWVRTRVLFDAAVVGSVQVLLFARDLAVPFASNQAVRDLRMIKAQLKISGGWRTQHGARVWLRVRGYISTVRMNGLRVIAALRDAITGNCWLPTTIEMA